MKFLEFMNSENRLARITNDLCSEACSLDPSEYSTTVQTVFNHENCQTFKRPAIKTFMCSLY